MYQAETLDTLISEESDSSKLAGIPLGVEDNICTLDIRTTNASRMLGILHPLTMLPL